MVSLNEYAWLKKREKFVLKVTVKIFLKIILRLSQNLLDSSYARILYIDIVTLIVRDLT